MAISGRHLQFVQAVIKTACNNCVCSGAPRAPWRLTKYTGVDPAAISGRQLRFRRRFSRYPSVYFEIATAPSGPRNDNSEALTILTAVCTGCKCVAGRGMPRPYKALSRSRKTARRESAGQPFSYVRDISGS